MSVHASDSRAAVPPMPERSPKALRAAIAQYAPHLLTDFDEHWTWAVSEAYDISTVPAFMARWWGAYAIARDPALEAHLRDLEHRAGESADLTQARALLEEASNIRYQAQRVEPGQ
ncbi:hypothetical protein J7I94_10325 [Streptomyces sp. ISL-12]|uniref:hypothetical protein n=1 Tax=Streptomyces sp. ISL-12 TaxID=2819177 RepID=UPI001BEAB74D|nr:hypothetical protein [Streptomyces sp. ISL-12]MBT2410957.1 hypothetical protein [Streptomyces sp. ISL-12]